MSDALLPWIRDYIISIAESYGANFSNIPLYPKNKKVQLIQFLTYGSDNQDTLIWAEISDKQYIIPVKFTKDAVADYCAARPGQRLTRHKGAIFRISRFRPISTRIPTTSGTLTTEPTLVLECSSLVDLGSSGEATFGSPEPILNHPDIRLWNDGLKKDGGAGYALVYHHSYSNLAPRNVLKNRKEERVPILSPPPPPSPPKHSEIHVDITRGKASFSSIDAYHAFWQASRVSFVMSSHSTRIMQKTAKNPMYQEPPTIAPPSLEYAQTEVEFEDINIPSSRSATPFSAWEATPLPRASPAPYDDDNQQRRSLVPRKIPRPASPVPMPKNHTGPALILAPNSDTSQSQSQSQSIQKEAEGFFRDTLGIDAGDYPWLDLWRIKEIMARTLHARRLANMSNIT
ncbi:hypothetical protein JR316_0002226 [Psilocybe cubensis]|uniref:Uncharacterized protein n=2 Tax=Psilocybe cubensis TaxID=181762 RepID=A0ACB8HBL6_PSICU|nr:hypothetical protein JR316_0002226 [Psilocybe cubensis]KAH9485318.1 hypothetical protein JR316_0002226 [Psilocybe cubensis]